MDCRDEQLVNPKPELDPTVIFSANAKDSATTSETASLSTPSSSTQGNAPQSVSSHASCFVRNDATHSPSPAVPHLQPHSRQPHPPNAQQPTSTERNSLNDPGWDAQDKALFIAGQHLIRSYACYKQLYESLPFGFCEVNAAGEILHCNRLFLDMVASTIDRVNYTPLFNGFTQVIAICLQTGSIAPCRGIRRVGPSSRCTLAMVGGGCGVVCNGQRGGPRATHRSVDDYGHFGGSIRSTFAVGDSRSSRRAVESSCCARPPFQANCDESSRASVACESRAAL